MFRLLGKVNSLSTTTYASRFFSTGKEITFGSAGRNKLKRGVDKIADAVQVTLGPRGRNVAIESSYGGPKITKDGVTVAKSIDLEDPIENMGAQLIKNVANRTNEIAGDGTTTATILSRTIFSGGTKAVEAGMNPMDLKRGIDLACNRVVEYLQTISKKIESIEQIEQVATISANNDPEIGKLIATAMAKVGREGAITVTEGKSLKDEVEVIEGMSWDQGVLSRYFFTDSKAQNTVFEDCLILLSEDKIDNAYDLVPILEKVARAGKKLLIIAENVESDALSALILNRVRGLQIAAVKGPGFGTSRTAFLQDIATLTGSVVASSQLGVKLSEMELEHLGTAKKITLTANDSLILGGGGKKEDIEERVSLIRSELEQSTSSYDKEKLSQRIAKLSGGVAVLKIGGASEVEVNEKKDRITDALNATRAAVEEGIVPGGGVALLYATRPLEELKNQLKDKHFDQAQGVIIVQNALMAPSKTIANNAGVEGSVVVEKLLAQEDVHYGYNAHSSLYTNLLQAGVVDPTKVVRTALIDACSVAALMTTTEAVITEIRKENGSSAPPMGGGMGGMGGMPGMF